MSRLLVAAVSTALLLAAPAAADPVDPNAPQIAIADPADGALYPQGQQVQAGYGCFPGALGYPIVSCLGDVAIGSLIDTNRVGTHTFTVRAEDYTGAITSVTHTYTVIDLTPPAITFSSPIYRGTYVLGTSVVVDYSCDDGPGGSGVLACIGSVPDGSALATDRVGTFGIEVTAFDYAGNRSTALQLYRVVDVTPPTISITQPAPPIGDALPRFRIGEVVNAGYSCQDDSGWVESCAGPVPTGSALDTSTIGTHTFTVTARDGSGNTATASRSYWVIYDFAGFFAPVANPPATTVVKSGDPVPLKFTLRGYYGLDAVESVMWRPISCATSLGDPDWASANGTLSYNAGADRYVFLWSTERSWTGTCRQVVVTLRDGTMHRASFRFEK